MRTKTALLTTLLATLTVAAAHANSDQYLRTGEPIRWHRRAVTFMVDPSMRDSSLTDPIAVIGRAASVWAGIANAPRYDLREGSIGAIGYDSSRPDANISGIAMYHQNFPRRVDRQVLALTLLTRNSATGEIVDADIILDAESNRFAVLSDLGLPGVATAPNDYQNVITHEVGHSLGLTEDPDHRDATMYPSSQPGEVSKRRLSPTDVDSVRRAYAAVMTDGEPLPAGGCGGASVVPRTGLGSGRMALAFVGVALLALLAGRSRKSKTMLYVGAAALVVLGAPEPGPYVTRYARVLSANTYFLHGVMVTRATVSDHAGVRTIERVGGRVGTLAQTAYDVPSGDDLVPGRAVALAPSER
jgi:hypothetical protein